jgi:hypothetical protein
VVNPQSLNRYSYTNNNPLTYTDPSGHAASLAGDGLLTPVGILDPNRVPLEEQRQVLFDWFDQTNGYYNPSADTVLNGLTYAGPVDVGLTNSIVNMEYGLWRLDRGDPRGADSLGAGVVAGVVALGPGAGTGIPGGDSPAPAPITDVGQQAGDAGLLGRTLRPGPYAGESIPARGPGRDFTAEEHAAIDRIGNETGCHTCGTTNPGTKSGHFVPDHQPANALNVDGSPQRLYPQCINCSRAQGGEITEMKRLGLITK